MTFNICFHEPSWQAKRRGKFNLTIRKATGPSQNLWLKRHPGGLVKHQTRLELQYLITFWKSTNWLRSGEKLSAFVDKILQPIAQQQKSYLKDTTDFVNFIERTKVPILASMDVTSLYSSIPQKEWIQRVCEAYSTFHIDKLPIPTRLCIMISQLKTRPPDTRDIAGNLTLAQLISPPPVSSSLLEAPHTRHAKRAISTSEPNNTQLSLGLLIKIYRYESRQ